MFFEKIYKPIPLVYNLVLAMLWRHPENVKLEEVKVVHYCAAVSSEHQCACVYVYMFEEAYFHVIMTGFKAMEVYWEGS